MQTNLQVNQLIDSLNGEPLAVSPGYWQAVASEITTLSGSLTAAESDRRRTSVAARLISSNGAALASGPVNLNSASSTPAGSIAHLQLSGLMLSHDYLWLRGVNHLTAELTAADSNPNVSGVLLEVNSGGGMVTAGQMLNATISNMSKPVVVFTHHMASAAIMGTLTANKIVASSRGVEVGSIGTLIQVDKLMAEYQRTRYKSIYADRSTRKNEASRAAQDGNYSPLQKRVNQVNNMFLADVKANRPLRGDVTGTLSGAMFMGADAQARGLVDDIGGMSMALAYLGNCIRFKESPSKSAAPKGGKKIASKSGNDETPAWQLSPMMLKTQAKYESWFKS